MAGAARHCWRASPTGGTPVPLRPRRWLQDARQALSPNPLRLSSSLTRSLSCGLFNAGCFLRSRAGLRPAPQLLHALSVAARRQHSLRRCHRQKQRTPAERRPRRRADWITLGTVGRLGARHSWAMGACRRRHRHRGRSTTGRRNRWRHSCRWGSCGGRRASRRRRRYWQRGNFTLGLGRCGWRSWRNDLGDESPLRKDPWPILKLFEMIPTRIHNLGPPSVSCPSLSTHKRFGNRHVSGW